MAKAFDFIVWVIGGGIVCLIAAFHEMWLSRTGRDKLSECKKILADERKK